MSPPKMRLAFSADFGIVWGGFVLLNGTFRAMPAAPALVHSAPDSRRYRASAHSCSRRHPYPSVQDDRSALRRPASRLLATRHTRPRNAWCSQNAASVAAMFARHGSLTINSGKPAVGRAAITASAQSFMTAFPTWSTMDRLEEQEARNGDVSLTLTGTNTGPGAGQARSHQWLRGMGHRPDGLIVTLVIIYEADYKRQLNG